MLGITNGSWARGPCESEWSLTCSPLRFLKSFSLISVILLFCRSSRVVSSGISSGTAFRPKGGDFNKNLINCMCGYDSQQHTSAINPSEWWMVEFEVRRWQWWFRCWEVNHTLTPRGNGYKTVTRYSSLVSVRLCPTVWKCVVCICGTLCLELLVFILGRRIFFLSGNMWIFKSSHKNNQIDTEHHSVFFDSVDDSKSLFRFFKAINKNRCSWFDDLFLIWTAKKN